MGLAGTELACAQGQTIRLKVLTIGAWVRVPVRKVGVRLASSCPSAAVFRQVHAKLAPLRPALRCGRTSRSERGRGRRGLVSEV